MWFAFRLYQISIINLIQTYFKPFEPVLLEASHFGDPGFGYLYYFTFCLALISPKSSCKILWITAVSEWINIMLKWMFSDDRPYWWAKEYVNEGDRIEIKQFPITCETGPGMPSGHVSMSTQIWFIFIMELIRGNLISSRRVKHSVFTFYFASLFIIAISRVYIAAHFPDQCLFGLISGFVNAFVLGGIFASGIGLIGHVLVSIIMIIGSHVTNDVISFYTHRSPNWSLELAEKWCFDMKYVKADTTSMFVVWRSSGAVLGIAIAFYFVLPKIVSHSQTFARLIRADKNNISIVMKIVAASLANCIIYYYIKFLKPNPNDLDQINFFYFVTFIQYTALPLFGVLSVVFIIYVITYLKLN